MTLDELITEVKRRHPDGTGLEHLAEAAAMAQHLDELADQFGRLVLQSGELVLRVLSPAIECRSHAKLPYLLSDSGKIRKGQDLAVYFARPQCYDFFH